METQPLEDATSTALLRAKTLELGEIPEDEPMETTTPQRLSSMRRLKSSATMEGASAEVNEVPESAEKEEKTPNLEHEGPTSETAIQKTDPYQVPFTQPEKSEGGGEGDTSTSEAEAPMVTREDQRELKEGQDKKNGKEPKPRGRKPKQQELKRPAARAKPASKSKAKAKASQKKKAKKPEKEPESEMEQEEEEEEEEEECLEATSPAPKDLNQDFEEAVDDGKVPPSKSSKRKAQDAPEKKTAGKRARTKIPEKDESEVDEKPKSKRTKSKGAEPADEVAPKRSKKNETKDKKDQDKSKDKKDGETTNEVIHSKKASGEKRTTFAGRPCPKGEQAKQRFDVMVATYNSKIGPFVVNGSQVEAVVFTCFH